MEARLLARLRDLHQAGRREPALLARPVRVLVPSRSLSQHVSCALVDRLGHAAAGVQVQTLYGFALEVLACVDLFPRTAPEWVSVMVRHCAREEPVLRRELGSLRDGFAAVSGSVSDLLDAGLGAEHAEAIEEQLDGLPLARAARERARAVVRVALGVRETLARHGLAHRSDVLRRAAETVQVESGAAPSRAVLIHGFADATGVASDLIEALLQSRKTEFFMDLPRDPAFPESLDHGCAFAERLLERVRPAARLRHTESAPPPPRPERVCAPTSDGEVRAVALRVRSLLDVGVLPEGIALVARDLTPYVRAVRQQFQRLAIPFSGGDTPLGSRNELGREAQALRVLLERRERTSAEVWLGLRAGGAGALGREDLRVGVHALGAGSLEDLARLDPAGVLEDAQSYALPVRRGLIELESGPVLKRRRVSRDAVEAAVHGAQETLGIFEKWRKNLPLGAHLENLRSLLSGPLGRTEDDALRAAVEAGVGKLGALEFPISTDEFLGLLARGLDAVGRSVIGGQGGGVQVLGVVEARARTFEHLFLLGMNRDVFPRPVREDPLLPDSLRGFLRSLLPDIPIKARGIEEERYLFAQLCGASTGLTLAWQTTGDDGKERTASPLIERLALGSRAGAVELAAVPFAPPAHAALRPAREHAILAGLYGEPDALAESWRSAMRELRPDLSGDESDRLADARLRILQEFERPSRVGVGAYDGFVGSADLPTDPRRARIFVTGLEAMAHCPWQTLLRRLLRLDAAPDAAGALPGVDRRVVGDLVHRVLDRCLADVLGERSSALRELLSAPAVALPTLSPESLEPWLAASARAVVREAGIALPGFDLALACVARPFVLNALALDFRSDAGLAVSGTELEGSVTLPDAAGRPREIHFRADRLDQSDRGPVLTDYKTGRPVSDRKRAATRERNLLEAVARGKHLQAAVYARALETEGGIGRYLFLDPSLDPAVADASVQADDSAVRTRLERAAAAILGTWDAGTFFPRLLDGSGKEPDRCRTCEVSEACLRGDHGARRRFADWADGSHESAAPLQSLWHLYDAEAKSS